MLPLRCSPPQLLLNNVSCLWNEQTVLRDMNLNIHDGTTLILTSANGSRKTTLLRMLAGFSRASTGEILWNDHDITSLGEKLTVLENVQWFELLEGKDDSRVGPAIELMELRRLKNEKSRMLSMGLLECIIAEHRKKGGIVFVATHLPIETDDSKSVWLLQRFPRRKTLVDIVHSLVEN
ncbi:hypothetical protein SETIT_5G165900v2 [Setaria italica]|uniref:ABC transporter domain-containing protein n=1 Tax=Setaria italica TaxID=4555 RepID=K3XQ56_SETIT|nr:hypothetical protein SETIT_5G165900v2 [Setaria italica]